MAKLVFEEQQRFNQWWLIALMAAVFLLMIRMLFRIIDAGPLNEESLLVIFLGILPLIILSVLFFLIQLRSRIDEEGISVGFYPFGFSNKRFKWKEIEKIDVVKYSPLKDYGGWGYRISINGKKAMNVRGNIGIKIFLKNGKQFLIGTQRPEVAKEAIKTYIQH